MKSEKSIPTKLNFHKRQDSGGSGQCDSFYVWGGGGEGFYMIFYFLNLFLIIVDTHVIA